MTFTLMGFHSKGIDRIDFKHEDSKTWLECYGSLCDGTIMMVLNNTYIVTEW